jgi:predicted peptidase
MYSKKIFLLLLTVTCTLSNAQISSIVGKTDYPFWVSLPKNYSSAQKTPILFFLHGRSLSGTDLNRVKRYGILKAIEKGREIPAIVVAPQLASGPWQAKKLLEVLDYIKQNYNIEEQQIYVCGMSLGGYGTLEFAGKYPEKITAAVAICGGGVLEDACNLSKIPLWILHGDNDRIVSISESKKIVEAIKICNPKADVIFTKISGGTHSSVEQLFHENDIYDWLFKQIKTRNP